MRRAWMTAIGSTIVLLAGCGPGPTPISAACTDDIGPLARALRAAPRAVVLPDGFTLSRCIGDGTDDAELQSVGLAFHQVAEVLRERARDGRDAVAATQLGYLIGATRRGAAHTNGVMAELQRRIEMVGGRLQSEAPALAGAVDRGVTAGEKLG